MSIRNNKELEFSIFCIESVAAFLEKDATEAYKIQVCFWKPIF